MMIGRGPVNRWLAVIAALLAILLPVHAAAEDGYELWLRYEPLEGEALERLREFNPRIMLIDRKRMVAMSDEPYVAPTSLLAIGELNDGLASLLGLSRLDFENSERDVVLECGFHAPGEPVPSFYSIRSTSDEIRIRGSDDLFCLYGAHALLRELSQGVDPAKIDIYSAPAMPLRMLNHWDNSDGSVERGYAGRSIFDWWRLPEHLDQRMTDYARANASIGINAVSVNNVNANPVFLTAPYIAKLKRLAHAWRPYGIRVFLSARFSAPRDLAGFDTADPLDPAVRAWWKAKADEIYAAIPDFGGFLVKANSEGQPGPQDYGRTHADGANMLAEALGERGTVIWRAFVYSAEDETDRAKQAFDEFVPLDGKFAGNVIVQVKNGPIDFQPREPFHPIFGAMPNTRLMFEGQPTKEYLGFSTHIAFLAPMWREALESGTGRGGTVADSISTGGMAGVANIGSDRNWSGSHFDQANWYAFGRLAWDPTLSSEAIAREWAAQTFSRDPQFLAGVLPILLDSREAVADYMTPLGLSHQMATGHHYGPGPWVCELPRPEWNPCYYHKADKAGIGFDRTAAGSNALEQYAPEVAALWADVRAIDPRYLLWFHHVPWDHPMRTGRHLWEELVYRYDAGVARVEAMQAEWAALEPYVDPERFRDVGEFLVIQRNEARWWRDASLAYWQSVNGLSLPEGVRPPEHDLEYYKSLSFPDAPSDKRLR
jgi:alpha-glucuronidase